MTNRLLRLVCFGWTVLIGSVFGAGPVPAAPTVNVLVSEPRGIYQEAADSLMQGLRQEGWTFDVSTPGRGTRPADLTVAIGTRALEAALAQPGRPILSLLVPRLAFERLASGRRRVSALYLDQPLSRQLQLLGLALPRLEKAGVPLGPSSQKLQADLESAGKQNDIQIRSAVIDESADLYGVLTALAEDSQAFVLLPDPLVVQRSTLQNFFLHTYRLKKPVLAYSAPLVQSGALLALYARPAQLGEEAATWLRESWEEGEFRLGPPRFPRRFTIAVNRTVARSLDIVLPRDDLLIRVLEARQ